MQAANGVGCTPQAAVAAAASRHHDGDLQGRQSTCSPQIMRPIAGPSDARIRAGQPGSPCLGPLPQRAWLLGALTDRPASQPSCIAARFRGAEPPPRAAGRPTATSARRLFDSPNRRPPAAPSPHGAAWAHHNRPAEASNGRPPGRRAGEGSGDGAPWAADVTATVAAAAVATMAATCSLALRSHHLPLGQRPRSSARITFGPDPCRPPPGA